MKIAIVCGHFLPSMGYIEVHLANAFHQLGHELCVFTTHIVPSYVKGITTIDDESIGYNIVRLKTNFSLGQMVKSKDLIPAITKYAPELVVIVGVGKLFPAPIYRLKNRNFKLVSVFGDNIENHFVNISLIKKIKNALFLYGIKKSVYESAIMESDVLLPYSPSTVQFISSFIGKNCIISLKEKSHQISFIFDVNKFFFDEEERVLGRKELAISRDDNLLVIITRVTKEKMLEKTIDVVDIINAEGFNLSYLIVGFQNDDYEKELKSYISEKKFSGKIICKPFSEIEQIRRYYNSADVGIFTRRTISAVEALASGLFLILPNQENVIDLVNEKNGNYYIDLTNDIIKDSINKSKYNRQERATNAKTFSNVHLAEKIIDLVEI